MERYKKTLYTSIGVIKMKRLINYLIGLNVLVLGITLNTRSLLGVAAFTTLPYAVKETTPISFGIANIILYMVLIVIQLLIERKIKLDILLEIPFSFIMGYIIDLYQMIIPASPESLGLRFVILLAGNLCTAFGVYTMIQSHFILAPVDGVVLSISTRYNKPYSLCKNCFDITMIVSTIILCLVTRSPFYGIGVGTIISALCVGRIIKWFEIKHFSLIRS